MRIPCQCCSTGYVKNDLVKPVYRLCPNLSSLLPSHKSWIYFLQSKPDLPIALNVATHKSRVPDVDLLNCMRRLVNNTESIHANCRMCRSRGCTLDFPCFCFFCALTELVASSDGLRSIAVQLNRPDFPV